MCGSERAYQQILQANGHDAEVWYQLGDAVLGQGRRAEAAEIAVGSLKLLGVAGVPRSPMASIQISEFAREVINWRDSAERLDPARENNARNR